MQKKSRKLFRGPFWIRNRIVLLTMGLSMTALLAISVVQFFYGLKQQRTQVISKIKTDAKIISSQTIAPLHFSDTETAREVLESLQSDRNTLLACVYDDSGTIFEYYTSGERTIGSTSPCPSSPPPTGYQFVTDKLEVSLPIFSEGQRIGQIYILRDTEDIRRYIRGALFFTLTLLIVSALVLYSLALLFRSIVSKPVKTLLDTAHQIAETADYSIRVEKHSDDEIGKYIDAYNRMLNVVEERDLLLQERQKEIQDILDAVPALIWLTDKKFRIRRVNRRVVNALGKEESEIEGLPFHEIYPNDFHKYYRHGTRVIRTGKPKFSVIERLVPKSGNETMWVSIDFLPERDPEKKTASGLIIVARDITELKKAKDSAEEYMKELERSNDELNSFAYVASHDLKAPLRAIDNLSRWIKEDSIHSLPEESINHLEQLQNRVSRMENLLDDLLNYSRIGRVNASLEKIDCTNLIEGIIDLLGLPKNFTIHIEGEVVSFTGYRVPLEQVIRNLIGNSIKHHDKDSGKINISFQQKNRFIEFMIEDDGPGIPEEYYKRVFMMFQTLKPRDEVEGSGMGLAVVKKIIESQGGTILLKSSSLGGSCFQFTWPLRVEKLSSVEQQTE